MANLTYGAIIDIDGTITNIDHRVHLAQAKEWDAFHGLSHMDGPVVEMVRLVNSLYHNQYHILLLTGRNERYREKTIDWLEDHDVMYDYLVMRPDEDWTSDAIIKPNMFDRHAQAFPHINWQFAIDDRTRVIEAWRKRGMLALQCAEGAF